MFPFTIKVPTSKKSFWKNTCEYIIVHHTWTTPFTGNVKYLSEKNWNPLSRQNQVSCHFVIWQNWDAAKIGDPTDILWHCWQSAWGKRTNMNRYSLWIEVCGPPFTNAQKRPVEQLIWHLMKTYWIPKQNVLRHADIAPGRKTDISPEFYSPKTFRQWIDSIDINGL